MNFRQQQPPVIISQPQVGSSFKRTTPTPPGLECLLNLDALFLRTEIVLFDEAPYRYHIFNNTGQQLYFAIEENDYTGWAYNWNFEVSMLDSRGLEVIHLYRPLYAADGGCCFACCTSPSLEVHAPRGNVIGYVTHETTFGDHRFKLTDAAGNDVLWTEKPSCLLNCFTDIEFPMLTPDKTAQVGTIIWQPGENPHFPLFVTRSSHYEITFPKEPKELNVQMKAVVMGACMLIDCMFFNRLRLSRRHR